MRSQAMRAVCLAAGWPYCEQHDRALWDGSTPCGHLHQPCLHDFVADTWGHMVCARCGAHIDGTLRAPEGGDGG